VNPLTTLGDNINFETISFNPGYRIESSGGSPNKVYGQEIVD